MFPTQTNSNREELLPLTFQEYAAFTRSTASYPDSLVYPLMKLAGETGEILEKFGKLMRDFPELRTNPDNEASVYPPESSEIDALAAKFNWSPKKIEQAKGLTRQAFIKEFGDVLWYVSEGSHQLRSRLDSIATVNMLKLTRRVETGTIHGSGDDREEQNDRPAGEQ